MDFWSFAQPLAPALVLPHGARSCGEDGLLPGCPGVSIDGRITASYNHQKHRQDFAVAEIQLEAAGDHGGDYNGDAAAEDKLQVSSSRRGAAQAAREIVNDAQQHPHEHQHDGQPALRGVCR